MELTTPTKKVIITDSGHELVHTMRRFKGKEFNQYKRRIARAVKVRKGGTSVDLDEGKIQMEMWDRMVESVEGYEHDGRDVMEKDNWKELVAELAPEHCVSAFAALTNVFSTDDGSDVPFHDDSSEDASDED